MNKFLKKDIQLIITTGSFIAFSILGVWFLWRNVALLTLVLFALALIELITIRSKKVTVMFFLCCIGGGVVESIAIYFGNWHYAEPTFFNIPLWLLPGWGNAGVFIIAFYKLLEKFKFLNQENI
jgi:hypothetical protein